MEADHRTELTQDTRPIKSIYFIGENAEGYVVGYADVTKIEPYSEYGQTSMVPWIAVFIGNEISMRVAAEHVSIN